MRLGDVLKKEREAKGISIQQMASRLNVSEQEYLQMEGGNSPAEKWGPLLAKIAIRLETPTARLISQTGRYADAEKGGCGRLIKEERERKQESTVNLAASAGLSKEEYEKVERGESPIEEFAPLLLCFAEQIDQPIFNLFYPCGLPLEKLENYP